MSIHIKARPIPQSFVARRKHSMKSILHIYRIYLRLPTISQLTNIRLRQNAKYFRTRINMIKNYSILNSDNFSIYSHINFVFKTARKLKKFHKHFMTKILLSPCGLLEVISFVIFSKKLCDSISLSHDDEYIRHSWVASRYANGAGRDNLCCFVFFNINFTLCLKFV
jgi:hypothetical protein